MGFRVVSVLVAALAAGVPEVAFAEALALDHCVSIALANHPVIKARQASYCAAVDQSHVARSYLGPDVEATVNYTFIDEPRSVDVDILSGQLGDRLLEAASFFEIARQSGSGAAVGSLNDLNGPAYQQTKQALANGLPSSVRVDLLGQNFVTSQISMIQPLYTAGKITSKYQQALAAADVAAQDVFTAQNEIAFGISQAYYTVVLSDLLTRVSREASGYAGGVEAMADSLVKNGDAYVTTDGEKPWRDRDDEFIDTFTSRPELMDYWHTGWSDLTAALDSLRPADLAATVSIRGQRLTVPLAIARSLSHYGYHVGQILLISRILTGDAWQTLTIPRGGSQVHNTKNWGS
jgi:Protein of unknown function (DUF1572)/Outer membrane efflux protein